MGEHTFALSLGNRFWTKVDLSNPDGCWLWTAATSGYGYGVLRIRGRFNYAHRMSYEAHIGPVPEGHDVDHLCHNRDKSCRGGTGCLHRRCVNPAHLEPATRGENRRRAPLAGVAAVHAGRTHCKNGHPLAGDNLRIRPYRRICVACQREWARNYMRRQRAK